MRARPEIDTLPRESRFRQKLRTLALLLLTGAIVVGSGLEQDAEAQDATPTPPVCNVEPRPVTFIADLLAIPAPEVTPTPVAGIPDGTEVTDPIVRSEVIAVVETLIACANQGQLLRAFSLYDDEYLRRLIDPEGLMRPDVAVELAKSMATPEAVDEDEETVLEEVLLIRQVEDDAVTVVFRTRGGPDREPDEAQVDLLVLRNGSNGWLIVDGLSNIDPDSLPAES